MKPLDRARPGAPVTVARIPWTPTPGLPGSVKHGSRAGWVLASRALGVTEVLLVHAGRILEANRSNVFAARAGALLTPPADGDCLRGVTRGALIEAGRAAGIQIVEAPLDAAGPFDELYLSSTLKELAPVVAIDGVEGPGGGPIGARLLAAFRSLVRREIGAG